MVKDFKNVKLSGSLTALYSNKIIQQIAGGLVGLFFPVMLYKVLGFSIYKVGLYFVFSWGIWFFMVPIGAKIMSKIGLKKSMMISVVFLCLYYALARWFEFSENWLYLIFVVIFVNLQRMLYWIPFHTDFAEFSDKKTRGRQMSFLVSVASLISILVPFVGGQVLENYGFSLLFIISIFIAAVSFVPLLMVPEVRENFSYSYFQTFKELFRKSKRKMLLSYAADGMQSAVGTLVWPIFIWLILDQSYSAMGIVTALIVLASTVLRLFIGDWTDKVDKKKVLKYGTWLNSLGWIMKMFVGTGFQIFAASTYHQFAGVVMRTPFDALMYEKAADSGHYVDEYTVLREMALGIGRLIMLALLFLTFFLTGSFIWMFLLAAVIALLMNLI